MPPPSASHRTATKPKTSPKSENTLNASSQPVAAQQQQHQQQLQEQHLPQQLKQSETQPQPPLQPRQPPAPQKQGHMKEKISHVEQLDPLLKTMHVDVSQKSSLRSVMKKNITGNYFIYFCYVIWHNWLQAFSTQHVYVHYWHACLSPV